MDSSNSADLFQGGGNTNSPPSKKQVSPSKRWCFTFNNYSNDDLDFLVPKFQLECNKVIVGKEVGESGTPHLQGYIEFKKKKRPLSVFESNRIHWEKAKRPADENFEYCSKDGNIFYSMGFPKPVVKVSYEMLRDEQKKICDLFKEDEDPLFGRLVYWFYEIDGNWGKSICCKYMIDCMGALVVQGKNNDILHGLKDYYDNHGVIPRLVVFDIPRCNENHVSYQAIESVKNGFFYSGKYEGGMVRFNSPHVICFSNEEPITSNLSEDRWVIKDLRGE